MLHIKRVRVQVILHSCAKAANPVRRGQPPVATSNQGGDFTGQVACGNGDRLVEVYLVPVQMVASWLLRKDHKPKPEAVSPQLVFDVLVPFLFCSEHATSTVSRLIKTVRLDHTLLQGRKAEIDGLDVPRAD